jgi:hypothetical protein
VGDQDQADAVLLHQLFQQAENLRLGRDVQRRRRLVGDQQAGRQGDGDGDGDALALAARQLVGIAIQREAIRGKTDPVEQGTRRRPGLGPPSPTMNADRFRDLVADGHQGVQRRHRLLEDDADLAAAHAAQDGVGGVRDHGAVEGDCAGHARLVRQKTQHGEGRHRLARAGLADQPQNFARGDGQRHRLQKPGLADGDAELVDFETLHLSVPDADADRADRAGRRPSG